MYYSMDLTKVNSSSSRCFLKTSHTNDSSVREWLAVWGKTDFSEYHVGTLEKLSAFIFSKSNSYSGILLGALIL